MKKVYTLFFLLLYLSFNAMAQESVVNEEVNPLKTTTSKTLQNWYVTATIGTPSLSPKDMTFKRMKQVSISQLTVGYKLTDRLSIGLGTMEGLGNCKSGYYNQEGVFTMFDADDDDNEDEFEDEDGLDDDAIEDETEDGDDNEDECENDELGENIMTNVTYHLTKHFFVQAAGGYGFHSKAPVYTAMVGYKHNLVCGLGVVAGLRYSDVLHKKPEGVTKLEKTSGLKAEVGLSWNF